MSPPLPPTPPREPQVPSTRGHLNVVLSDIKRGADAAVLCSRETCGRRQGDVKEGFKRCGRCRTTVCESPRVLARGPGNIWCLFLGFDLRRVGCLMWHYFWADELRGRCSPCVVCVCVYAAPWAPSPPRPLPIEPSRSGEEVATARYCPRASFVSLQGKKDSTHACSSCGTRYELCIALID